MMTYAVLQWHVLTFTLQKVYEAGATALEHPDATEFASQHVSNQTTLCHAFELHDCIEKQLCKVSQTRSRL